jgi:hypothetical protein
MVGSSVTAAFPGSANQPAVGVARWFQSLQCFGSFMVGAHPAFRAAQVGGRAPGSSASASLLGSVVRPFQSMRGSGSSVVGARGGWRPAGLPGFGEFARVGRFAFGGWRPCRVWPLGLVSFGRCAQANRRAPVFMASGGKGVLGFMGTSRLTFRSTGRRGGTAASTKPCRPGAGQLRC